jgi:hypothetical protein
LVPKTDENVPHHSSRKLFLECLYFVNEKKRKKEKRKKILFKFVGKEKKKKKKRFRRYFNIAVHRRQFVPITNHED